MGNKGTITGQWISGKNEVQCKLPLILFQEDDVFITYCPALDLSGYGNSEKESNNAFEEVLSEYFRYTINKKTLAIDLKKLGWILRKNLRKPISPPPLCKLLEMNDDFSRIFNNHDFRKTETTINIPAFA